MRYALRTALMGFVILAWTGGVTCSALAENTEAAPSAKVQKDALSSPAAKYVQDVANRAIGILSDKSLAPEQHTQDYHAILHDSFDLPTIGRFVIGRSWNSATPEQQKEYMTLFEELVVKIYADRLTSYKGENVRVTGARQENDKDSVVSSEIVHPSTGAPPTHMDWRVRQKGDKFAIIDVVIEGVSQSVSQREEYAAVINRDGGKIDGLLAQMRTQLQAPSATGDQSG